MARCINHVLKHVFKVCFCVWAVPATAPAQETPGFPQISHQNDGDPWPKIEMRIFSIMAVLFFSFLGTHLAAQYAPSDPPMPAPGPPVLLTLSEKPGIEFPFFTMSYGMHPYLGNCIAGLGDVNGDGYNDYAASTNSDTVFIFFGGPSFHAKPDAFVLGGGRGFVAGDLNGDGYTDIVAAMAPWETDDTERRGSVRIYLHNHRPTMYDSVPNLLLRGRYVGSGLGGAELENITGCDVNGDGLLDVLVKAEGERWDNKRSGSLYLYIGKATPDTIPAFVFIDSHVSGKRSKFAHRVTVGDLNGDGCDDLVLQGQGRPGGFPTFQTNWEVHLGNKNATFGAPYRDLTCYSDTTGKNIPLELVDVNGDRCPEIFYPSQETQDPLFAWGMCDTLFAAQTFLPTMSFPNPLRNWYNCCVGTYQLGDFNGDGFREYVMEWAMGNVWETWIYRSKPGWNIIPIAMYEAVWIRDNIYPNPYNIGDLNGDGTDEFALISSGLTSNIWIYKGSKQLVSADRPDDAGMTIVPYNFTVHPNPVTSASGGIIHLEGMTDRPQNVEVVITDVLGRTILTKSMALSRSGQFHIPLDVSTFKKGEYIIHLTTDGRISNKILVVP
jgi:hypothetical protein